MNDFNNSHSVRTHVVLADSLGIACCLKTKNVSETGSLSIFGVSRAGGEPPLASPLDRDIFNF